MTKLQRPTPHQIIPTPSPTAVPSGCFATSARLDVEAAMIRNQTWFDTTSFYLVPNGVMEKPEVKE